MKVEDPSALLVQWFHHKPKYLPKGDESSWQNYTNYAAQGATTKRVFIATGKTFMDTRNTGVSGVDFNGRQMLQRNNWAALGRKSTPSALFAEKQCMCITIESTTFTTPAQTGNADTPFLHRSLRPSQLHPCPGSLERQISSGCAIRSM